ncbi:hypothetical protein ACFPJ4_09280 [Lysinimonas soli]|uniref:Uncharacterized protein n=1 Tax=Lysinimonas soli TaxID=1074233 RepID=A0ABW0NPF3_9MICO
MDWLIFAGILVVLIGLGVLAQFLGWIDLSNKSTTSGGSGSGLAGIGDEVFHPTRYETQLEQDRQTMLPAPAPVAGDGDKDIYKGSVRIDVSGRTR